MTYDEFLERAKEILEIEGLALVKNERDENYVLYFLEYMTPIISFSYVHKNVIDTGYKAFKLLSKCKKESLFELGVELAVTPIRGRTKEKKYYLKHKWLSNRGDNFLNHDEENGVYFLDDLDDDFIEKVKFTKEEIKELKIKLNTDLNDFEMIEVK